MSKKLNALHPSNVVIENHGEYLDAIDYPLSTLKVNSVDDDIFVYMNVMKDGTKQWVEIGDSTGDSGINGLQKEIADRIDAIKSLQTQIDAVASVGELTSDQMDNITAAISKEVDNTSE